MAKALSVTINGKEFVSPEAKKAEDSLSGLKKTTEVVMSSLKVGAEIAAGAFAAAVGSLTAAVKVAGVTDNIDKMSQKLGMSRQAYQEWDFIMSQSGASIDGLKTSENSCLRQPMQAIPCRFV